MIGYFSFSMGNYLEVDQLGVFMKVSDSNKLYYEVYRLFLQPKNSEDDSDWRIKNMPEVIIDKHQIRITNK